MSVSSETIRTAVNRLKLPSFRLINPEYPALDLSRFALGWCELRMEKLSEHVVFVCLPHPFGRRERILLVGRTSCGWEAPTPQRRIDLRDY